ncbi:hypothetical protein D9V96_015105 [Zobellia laminariae]|uniref:hypothetical protein n=1 Tax=Zobellia laminariae TaxID=248906 RepID=UPI0012D862C2
MEKLIQGNIYIDIFLTLTGISGAVYYYDQNWYILGSILAIIGIIGLAKILDPFLEKS